MGFLFWLLVVMAVIWFWFSPEDKTFESVFGCKLGLFAALAVFGAVIYDVLNSIEDRLADIKARMHVVKPQQGEK